MQKKIGLFLLFFIISFFLLALRNLAPFEYPTMYAEDGVWSGLILTEGFWHTAFNARPEFPVFGLAALLDISIKIGNIFFNGDITKLPLVIFFVSNAFISVVATLAYLLAPKYLSKFARICIFISVLLIPVGSDGNEIYGRVLNLNWLFPVLQLTLIVYALENKIRSLFGVIAATFCTIAALTFPICIGINLIACAFLLFKFLAATDETTRDKSSLYMAIVIAAATILALISLGPTALTSKGGADLPFAAKGLVEFAFARLLLFPLIFPFYHHLNNILVLFIAMFFIFAMSSVTTYLLIFRRSITRSLLFILSSFCCYFFAMILLRSGFTSWYGEFNSTFPDRYFYGLNVIFLILLIYATDLVFSHKETSIPFRMVSRFVPIYVFFILLGSSGRIFELSTPKMNWTAIGNFEYSVCAHMSDLGPVKVDRSLPYADVPIYPIIEGHPWRMKIPLNNLQFLTAERCDKVFSNPAKKPS